MEESQNKIETQEPSTRAEQTAEPVRRPWVKPAFQRESLKDAITGPVNVKHNTDGPNGYS